MWQFTSEPGWYPRVNPCSLEHYHTIFNIHKWLGPQFHISIKLAPSSTRLGQWFSAYSDKKRPLTEPPTGLLQMPVSYLHMCITQPWPYLALTPGQSTGQGLKVHAGNILWALAVYGSVVCFSNTLGNRIISNIQKSPLMKSCRNCKSYHVFKGPKYGCRDYPKKQANDVQDCGGPQQPIQVNHILTAVHSKKLVVAGWLFWTAMG